MSPPRTLGPGHTPPHCVFRGTRALGAPGLLPTAAGSASVAAAAAPGPALITLLGELAAQDLPVRGMTLTRLQGTLTLPGGLAVSYCCGWLVWPAGRPSGRGRPLHTLHNAHDPAGAARRLTQYQRDGDAGGNGHD